MRGCVYCRKERQFRRRVRNCRAAEFFSTLAYSDSLRSPLSAPPSTLSPLSLPPVSPSLPHSQHHSLRFGEDGRVLLFWSFVDSGRLPPPTSVVSALVSSFTSYQEGELVVACRTNSQQRQEPRPSLIDEALPWQLRSPSLSPPHTYPHTTTYSRSFTTIITPSGHPFRLVF